jgi:hypothetical protein
MKHPYLVPIIVLLALPTTVSAYTVRSTRSIDITPRIEPTEFFTPTRKPTIMKPRISKPPRDITPTRRIPNPIQEEHFKLGMTNILASYEDRLSRYNEFIIKLELNLSDLTAAMHNQNIVVPAKTYATIRNRINTARTNLAEAKRMLALARVRINALDWSMDQKILMKQIHEYLAPLKDAMVILYSSNNQAVADLREATKRIQL